MEILPLILAVLFVFVAYRVARLAVDPSARQLAPQMSAPEPAGGAGRS